jgi:TetR/AcrR family transcriptional regulator, regulator of cefoperazone and chloramphenicol sensitivity
LPPPKQAFNILNMRSAAAEPRGDDRSTKARIRDAAVGLFGRIGFARTTVRAVATAAGVSPGLILHHFGSKAGLRRACDDFVIGDAARRGRDKADPAKATDLLEGYLADPGQYDDEIAYLRQALSDQSEAGDRLFDAVVRQTAQLMETGAASGTVRTFSDPHAAAVVIASNSLAILVLSRHIARSLGTAVLGGDAMRRLAVPALELYTHGFYTDTAFLDAARSATGVSATGVSATGDEAGPSGASNTEEDR